MCIVQRRLVNVAYSICHLRDDEVYAQPELVARLRFLTNGGWGRHPIGSAFLEDLDTKRPGDFFIATRTSDNQVVGWAFMTERLVWPGAASKQIGVYVERPSRRQGIAQQLVSAATTYANSIGIARIVACPWNPAGEALFSKTNCVTERNWF